MTVTKIVIDDRYLDHLTGPGHPERPGRILAIKNALFNAGCLNANTHLFPRLATPSEVLLCHTASYYSLVKKEIESLQATASPRFLSTGDVCISPASLETALLAVGGVLTAADEVMQRRAKNIFVVARPPGHHASSNRGMGFCLFNQAAIGARYLQQTYGIERVLIVDWDVHHGNGTQEIFYEDPSVYYFSTHQAGIYPGTGFTDERGKGAGAGTTLNFPIFSGTASVKDVFTAFKMLEQEMEKFRPEFILISCGFDAHTLDPLGGLHLQDADFEEMTKLVGGLASKYCSNRLISILEGGYSLEALATASLSHVKILLQIF